MHRLFQAFANAADGVLVIDQDQHIIYWNQAAEEILGYTPDEVVGQPCYEILKGRDNQGRRVCRAYCRPAATALQGGTVMNYDSYVRTKAGDGHWINISTFTIPLDEVEAETVLVHLFRDITQKKQNEQFTNQVLAAARQLQTGLPSQATASISTEQHETNLTAREGEVLSFLGQGLSTNAIARSLSISPATVRNHIRNILQKLQVHNRLEAVIYALEQGLIAKD